ncbi:MAG: PAS domain S-box protein, partial [Planctomycetaceae bacterium]|nr:PAS domain S-box protein [Planctomycetaceae bacterium]
IGQPVSRFYVDQTVLEDILARLSRGDTLRDYPARLRCRDGSIRHFLIDSNAWFESGEWIHTRCFLRDITDSHQAQVALKNNEERLGAILQAAQVGTWEWDLTLNKFDWSPNTAEIHGFIPGTLGETLETFLERIHGEDRELVEQTLLQAKDHSHQMRFEYRLNVRSDQEERWYEGVAHRLSDLEGQPSRVVGICRDITKQKRAEFALRQKDRLTAVGTLAAGLAHEINNPLSALLTSAGVAGRLLDQLDCPDRVGECLELIQSEAERIRQIVKNVACFAKQGSSPKSLCHAKDIAERAGQRIRAYADMQNVHLEYDLEGDLPPIVANATEIEQVLINLVSNAIEASQEGQTVSLRISRDCETLRISVVDQGHGMTSTDLDRLFDPFYTRKQDMAGTGLGLSIVHRLVADHGGKIEVQSSLNDGTNMTVILPIAE